MSDHDAPRRIAFGRYRGVALSVAIWDAVDADLDLSCACMFTHEIGEGPTGGLHHLDQVMSGRLIELRRKGIFRADVLETLLLTAVPGIRSHALMIMGLGNPDAWHADVMYRATARAVGAANERGALRAGIAPSLLDSGLSGQLTEGGSDAMLRGVLAGIDTAKRLAEFSLAPAPSLVDWTFGAGQNHADAAAAHFAAVLVSLTGEATHAEDPAL